MSASWNVELWLAWACPSICQCHSTLVNEQFIALSDLIICSFNFFGVILHFHANYSSPIPVVLNVESAHLHWWSHFNLLEMAFRCFLMLCGLLRCGQCSRCSSVLVPTLEGLLHSHLAVARNSFCVPNLFRLRRLRRLRPRLWRWLNPWSLNPKQHRSMQIHTNP